MNALETYENILNQENLINADLRYCLVTENKIPMSVKGENIRPNKIEDFVSLSDLLCEDIDKYAGIGISIQASKICAIDVDHCFSEAFNISSGDDRAKEIIEMFKNLAYIEFSFSGTGLRILFKHDIIENYSDIYYIKNSKKQIEYYQPSNSYRYVTLTGKTIYSNKIESSNELNSMLKLFLDKYMLKPKKCENEQFLSQFNDNKSIDELLELVKYHYLKNSNFQDVWFSKAPGFKKDESDRDYYLISYIYRNITMDKEKIKTIFETSPFFKSKDWAHVRKWEYNNNRYFNYIYNQLTK